MLDTAQPLIPAASPGLAVLETRLLFACGQLDYRREDESLEEWANRRTCYPPLGIRYLVPEPEELQVSLHPYLVPQFVDQVLPRVEAEGAEVHGIAGLRARVHDRFVLLYRPGRAGRIRVRISRRRWDQAARHALRGVSHGNVPWLTHPDTWHPAETAFHDRYGYLRDCGPNGSAFLSGLLRRCHALNGNDYTQYWHLWGNRRRVELEWRGGVTHQSVLDRLLDPRHGLNAQPDDPTRTCRCDDTTTDTFNECFSIVLRTPGGISLNLRRHRPYEVEDQALASRVG
ncbi:hypothetical protein E1264_25090 [Actinomadura sp. KC216]|uniref:hypothetical protein n=1 Tax=Actinomadura sp. KC216 TaxID=2530370 RepID=UPI001042EB5D|nr:hypothetical protein [Actinomadura sp. KC216]TDB84322.1 hypothetical protein E1264_25090 [Actinomadura sp. KC216]